MTIQLKTPVAFIIFNRPKCTRRVFAEIRKARPQKLYLIADGPRPHKQGEAEICVETRQLVEDMIDWPCEVHKDYSEKNMGCRWRVVSGINNVFKNEERAIILEDDCLPSQSFFPFCEEMLERYKDEERIMQVCGTNKLNYKPTSQDSYFFSRYAPIWGWATWRRAWNLYDPTLAAWPKDKDIKAIHNYSYPEVVCHTREHQLDLIYRGELDTWDFGWMYTFMQHNGIAIIPCSNLIRNIGFALTATHTMNPFSMDAIRARKDLPKPYRAPLDLNVEVKHDKLYVKRVFLSKVAFIRQCISRLNWFS